MEGLGNEASVNVRTSFQLMLLPQKWPNVLPPNFQHAWPHIAPFKPISIKSSEKTRDIVSQRCDFTTLHISPILS